MVNALELAKYILKHSNKELSNLELQKTLYFTELDYIKKFDKHLAKRGICLAKKIKSSKISKKSMKENTDINTQKSQLLF